MVARFACLFVPSFSLAARLRCQPDLRNESFALVQKKGLAADVIAVTPAAERAGIRPGFTLSQAKSCASHLIVREADPDADRAAQSVLLEVADSFSPRYEARVPGLIFIDISGTRDEAVLGRALARRTAAAALPARVGIGSSKQIAEFAAQTTCSCRACSAASLSESQASLAATHSDSFVVPDGTEPAFLAPLPLRHLYPSEELSETLARWGIHTVGQFRALPEGKILSHLGKEGMLLYSRAQGLDEKPLAPYRRPLEFFEGKETDWPLLQLESFLFAAKDSLERLVARLRSFDVACRRLDIALKLDPHGHDARSITFAAPTNDLKTFFGLIRLELERRPPEAPIVGMSFTAEPEKVRQVQLSLFGRSAIAPDRLSTTIARLSAVLGPDRIGSPQTVDGHKPERRAIGRFSPPPPPELPGLDPNAVRRRTALTAIRVLRPPVALDVEFAQERPRAACSRSRNSSLKIEGKVRVASGPWRMEEGWWTDNAAQRDYWDVELSDGAVYRIYCEKPTNIWFADGVYD